LGRESIRAVDAAGPDALVAEEIPEFAGGVVVLAEVEDLVFAGVRVAEVGPGADDEELHLLEVGEDGQGDAAGKGVLLRLEDVTVVKGLGGFLGLAGEALGAVEAEDVVGAGLAAGEVGADLDVHLALGVDQALLVAHIPAEGAEESIEEIGTQRGLIVIGRGVGRMLAVELGDEAGELGLEGCEGGWGVARRHEEARSRAGRRRGGKRGGGVCGGARPLLGAARFQYTR
jgi:hypothetical protein